MTRILIADDEEAIRSTLRSSLEKAGLEVETAVDGERALEKLRRGQFDIVLIDIHMPKSDGTELLAKMEDEQIDTDVILMSGEAATTREASRAGRFRVYEFLEKPFMPGELMALLNEVTESRLMRARKHLPPREVVHLIDDCIREHSRCVDFHMGELVRKVGFSQSHVAELMKRHLDTTFSRRLKNHRVEHAKRLLKDSEKNLGQIADECGFRHQSRLSKAFRDLEGWTPSEYRKAQR